MLKFLATFAIVTVCCGVERDKYFINNENKTAVENFTQTMKILDYKVDNRGEKLSNDCEEKSNKNFFSEYINTLSAKIFELQPPFDFSGASVSLECHKASEIFVESLKNFELWALKSE